jgi:hypothetical protein
MKQAKYVGDKWEYAGHVALLKEVPDEPNKVLVQFDNLNHHMSHGWHLFPAADWEILK